NGCSPSSGNPVRLQPKSLFGFAEIRSITPMLGHVTSSYMSPILGHPIALAVIKDGLNRMGQRVFVSMSATHCVEAEICNPIFYDPEGVRQHVE
ncbi:glycine cleavage T C-terminal barrel domain-containing protein, partial [Burkholderia vietnamiensis]|uniref:glycine cleavage T C-terminal barrel domain-containing protein n=1 Tax=Burkholderia vietnamiensis TaxID=60552 RepID=UPI002EDA6EDF